LTVVYPTIAAAFAPQDEATRAAWRSALGIAGAACDSEREAAPRTGRTAVSRGRFRARCRTSAAMCALIICGTGPLKEALEVTGRARPAWPIA
jgi:hypothetical protein